MAAGNYGENVEQDKWTIFRNTSDLKIWWWMGSTNEWFYEDDRGSGWSAFRDPLTLRQFWWKDNNYWFFTDTGCQR